MLEIKTAKLKQIKKVNIDGHVYEVRKLGAGEQLTLSQYMREVQKIENKVKNNVELSDEDEANALEYSAKMLQIFEGCFNDLGDGTKSKALINELSPDELANVLTEIFKENADTNEQQPAKIAE